MANNLTKTDKILVLDFGGQYAHLIANRIRKLGVFSEIKDGDVTAAECEGYKGIILSGGPSSTLEEGSPQCDPELFELDVPILGICYGHQLMVKTLGGKVQAGHFKEYGHANLLLKKREAVFADLDDIEQVWMSHGDTVISLPAGFETAGSTEDCEQAAIINRGKNFFGIQFHAEVTHTPHGMSIFKNFIKVCGAEKSWSIENFLEEEISRIKNQVGENKVFLLVSGGVDSTVAFALLEKALGAENVYGLFVDTGFMRLDERQKIESSLKAAGFDNLHVYDAAKEFFEALKEKYDPEEKRKIIGQLFLDVQAKVVNQLKLDPEKWILGQGTIYPDTIETGGTKHADTIKTHHNRVEQIQKLIDEGKVIEPLKDLYKDEVRELGELLDLPQELIWRHPFPGPGLAVRCLCSKGEEVYPSDYKKIEEEITELSSKYGLKAKIMPIKSVGVQGDARTYRHPAVLYGAEVDWVLLASLSTKITNRFAEVNRVLFTPKSELGDFSVKKTYLEPGRIALLQWADDLVHDMVYEAGVDREIWQFPVVLLPLNTSGDHKESIVLRPVCSTEAMTANFYAMPSDLYKQINESLLKGSSEFQVSEIFYDISNKPPGTIEWE